MKEYRDASNRLSFHLRDQDDDFTLFSERMQSLYGKPVQTLHDCMYEQRWWDFEVEGTTVVLHTDVMAGVSIHVEDGTHEGLLREIVHQLTDISSQNSRGANACS